MSVTSIVSRQHRVRAAIHNGLSRHLGVCVEIVSELSASVPVVTVR